MKEYDVSADESTHEPALHANDATHMRKILPLRFEPSKGDSPATLDGRPLDRRNEGEREDYLSRTFESLPREERDAIRRAILILESEMMRKGYSPSKALEKAKKYFEENVRMVSWNECESSIINIVKLTGFGEA